MSQSTVLCSAYGSGTVTRGSRSREKTSPDRLVGEFLPARNGLSLEEHRRVDMPTFYHSIGQGHASKRVLLGFALFSSDTGGCVAFWRRRRLGLGRVVSVVDSG